MHNYLDFEKPIAELEGKIEELRHLSSNSEVNIADEVGKLQSKVDKLLRQTYGNLSAWQKTQVARHPDRPHAVDYISALIEDFTPLAGDRGFAEDRAMVGGLGRFRGESVVIIGNEKGAETEDRVALNFGMARPEGYRKAIRLMEMADRFKLPVITLVDTPGAYPGVDAEARGQAEAIARSIETCFSLKVPLISVIIGEGGSGGAMALAAANQVLMLENAIYSVISPEGCASILWRDGEQAQVAAEALKLTSEDLLEQKVIDSIINEPLGGAHRSPETTIVSVGEAIEGALKDMSGLDGGVLKTRRRDRFLALGSKVVE
ncbi:MAG: acetyl-CoA carboxylase carboxyltransferase subunit alpha [Rhodospirillaceae bacterium]|nr:acetyl-CoA carboxylase carboxyltransferase subunit alpha [Rhodospirillaceae bacterium]